MTILTLMTDFGSDSPYVGVLKGAIVERLSQPSAVALIDLTHSIEPQNVRQGAFVWSDFTATFPKNTVHLGVVDPGVGSRRKLIAVRCGGQFFVCPDNGLITFLAERCRDMEAFELTEPGFWRLPAFQVYSSRLKIPEVGAASPATHGVCARPKAAVPTGCGMSATFHGRDILGPVAAAIANGTPLERLGTPCSTEPVRLPVSKPGYSEQKIEAEIIAADSFGNLFLNIRVDEIPESHRQYLIPQKSLTILIEGCMFDVRFVAAYTDAPQESPVLLEGSSGRLEIAVVNGSAADFLHVTAQDQRRTTTGIPVTLFLSLRNAR
ncbi:MAG: SAM-dependent chlorinase/fluorinase [Planctomycetaceae bacterium]|nr:SAM-dependent chlorinase/fluorinase [Planctomycetaceae bacterium]